MKTKTTTPTSSLDSALSAAEALLSNRDRTMQMLAETHQTIPALLREHASTQAELGRAEIDRSEANGARFRLNESDRKCDAAKRMRASSIEKLFSMKAELAETRAAVVEAQRAYAASVVEAFNARYAKAVAELQRCWREAEQLSGVLRIPVDTPLPVRLEGGLPKQNIHPWPANIEPARLIRIPGVALDIPPVDPITARIGSVLNRLDAAIDFSAGIRETRQREIRLGRQTEVPAGFQPSAVYCVVRGFACHHDGLEFATGELVDASLVGNATLVRLYKSKAVRLFDGAGVAAA